jgi:O-acetyl-ADP-ribose deacetylase (regulator of RNase III)
VKQEFNIGESLAEPRSPSNPESSAIIRILEGEYVHQEGIEALVSFIPEDLSWQGPINSILLREVGQKLDDYILETVVRPKRGDVFSVPADIWDGPRLLFAVVPKWDGGMDDEERVLKKCFKNSLLLAEELGIGVLAMPALGAGRKDFPIRKAGRLILNAIRTHHFSTIKEVRIVCKTSDMMEVYQDLSTG